MKILKKSSTSILHCNQQFSVSRRLFNKFWWDSHSRALKNQIDGESKKQVILRIKCISTFHNPSRISRKKFDTTSMAFYNTYVNMSWKCDRVSPRQGYYLSHVLLYHVLLSSEVKHFQCLNENNVNFTITKCRLTMYRSVI